MPEKTSHSKINVYTIKFVETCRADVDRSRPCCAVKTAALLVLIADSKYIKVFMGLHYFSAPISELSIQELFRHKHQQVGVQKYK